MRWILTLLNLAVAVGCLAAGFAAVIKGDPGHVWAAYWALSFASAEMSERWWD